MTTPSTSTQNGEAQTQLFNNPEFARRYKLAEYITGAFGKDLLYQMGLGEEHSHPHPHPQQPDAVTFLDLACGTGIVSKDLISILNARRSATRLLPDDRITCLDFAPQMLEMLEARIGGEAWVLERSQIELKQGDMKDTQLAAGTYSHVACNFGPVVAPDPDRVLRECFRVLRAGGVAGWTAWNEVGWRLDVVRAIKDIREDAKRRVEDGHGTEEDQKLSWVPDVLDSEEMMGRFAGIDVRKLRAEGIAEENIPRWDTRDYFREQAEQAGFVDVKVELVQKDFSVEYEMVSQMTTPLVGVLRTFWSDEEKKATEGVDLSSKLNEWWRKRFSEADVKDGVLIWDSSRALVVTGRKP